MQVSLIYHTRQAKAGYTSTANDDPLTVIRFPAHGILAPPFHADLSGVNAE